MLLVFKLCFILFLGLFFLPILVPAMIFISVSLILLFPAWSVYMFGLLLPEIMYKCPKKIIELSTEGNHGQERQVSFQLDPYEFPNFDLSESEEDEIKMDEVCIDQEANPTPVPEIRGQKSFDELMSFWRRQAEEKQYKYV
uniref:Uncharacterized protein n=2 Tax=Nicotiana TaxID=4085 RepID=A0A1S4D1E2_TOBAC|nr:PREDICTED: uncharacterized protein LOC104235446 [Nicotiana sylvestris]XP_016507138.1 PREDICTED: uncharacterized protein LOC107824844 [Nicotiana tabacum]